jgi:hypothetical protein
MAPLGTRNRKAPAAVGEELAALIPPSPTDHQPQGPQMQLKRWDELRELYRVSRDDRLTDLP